MLPRVDQQCIVIYNGFRYIGKVLATVVEKDETKVSIMECQGGNRFKFPTRPDVLWYTTEHVVRLANVPKNVTNHGIV